MVPGNIDLKHELIDQMLDLINLFLLLLNGNLNLD